MPDVNQPALDAAAEIFLTAARTYRESVKRNGGTLAGVLWVTNGSETVIYSENSKYSKMVRTMTHDVVGDEIRFAEVPDPE